MKNLFNDISQDERNRILEMHKSATRKNYLFEQGTPATGTPATGTPATGAPATNTIARFSPQNPDLYQKFIKIDMLNDKDTGMIYSLFDPQGSFIKKDNSIPGALYLILSQALGYYASRGKTPNDVKFSEVLTYGGVITAGRQIYKNSKKEMIEKRDINGIPIKDESGKYVYETNYEFLFGPALRKDSNQVNLLNTATGGINSAFKKYFDWKLNNSNV